MQCVRLTRVLGLVAALALGSATIALACNVPVFRFALERWRPDPYRFVLYHRGPLSAADLETIRPLEEQQDKALANVVLRAIDVADFDQPAAEGDEQSALDRRLFAALGEVSLPRLAVHYPEHLRIDQPVWSGAPGREAIASLLDSPVRQELIKRLAEGQTAVWLLLEPAAGGAASATLLETELNKLEQELKLPELTSAPEDTLLVNTPLKVDFSLLRVRRDDPAEQELVAMLIHSEPDLAERSDAMVFPIFGRGRALLALIGAGITAKNIHDTASFLVSACSCEVKELNPGFDLLLAADWEKRLSADGVPIAAPAAAAAPAGPPVLVPIPTGAAQATVSSPTPVVEHPVIGVTFLNIRAWLIAGGSLLAALILVGAIVVFAQFRASSNLDDRAR